MYNYSTKPPYKIPQAYGHSLAYLRALLLHMFRQAHILVNVAMLVH